MHGLSFYQAQNAYEKSELTVLQGTLHKALGNITEHLSRVRPLFLNNSALICSKCMETWGVDSC